MICKIFLKGEMGICPGFGGGGYPMSSSWQNLKGAQLAETQSKDKTIINKWMPGCLQPNSW